MNKEYLGERELSELTDTHDRLRELVLEFVNAWDTKPDSLDTWLFAERFRQALAGNFDDIWELGLVGRSLEHAAIAPDDPAAPLPAGHPPAEPPQEGWPKAFDPSRKEENI